jgi:hypothetical protein
MKEGAFVVAVRLFGHGIRYPQVPSHPQECAILLCPGTLRATHRGAAGRFALLAGDHPPGCYASYRTAQPLRLRSKERSGRRHDDGGSDGIERQRLETSQPCYRLHLFSSEEAYASTGQGHQYSQEEGGKAKA